MKKLYILLSNIACVSSVFAANTPVHSDYDDCGREMPTAHSTQVAGVETAANTSATRSIHAWMETLEMHSQDSPLGVSPTSAKAVSLNQGDESGLTQATLTLYNPTFVGKGEALTKGQLQERYASMEEGQHFYATYKPEIHLNSKLPESDMSFFDSISWVANVRAWAKWWLNPWAWWSPVSYSLAEEDKIVWDDSTLEVSISVDKDFKDIKYISSQLHQFLLEGWNARYYPYIVPATRARFEEAVRLRFENVEKAALESVGFKDITLETRVNLTTQQLEYYVLATK